MRKRPAGDRPERSQSCARIPCDDAHHVREGNVPHQSANIAGDEHGQQNVEFEETQDAQGEDGYGDRIAQYRHTITSLIISSMGGAFIRRRTDSCRSAGAGPPIRVSISGGHAEGGSHPFNDRITCKASKLYVKLHDLPQRNGAVDVGRDELAIPAEDRRPDGSGGLEVIPAELAVAL